MSNAQDLIDYARDVGELASAIGSVAQSIPGVRAAYKASCRIFAGTPGGQALGLLNIPNICTPFLAEDGRTFGGVGDPPFFGGQCPGDIYRVTINVIRNGNVVAGPLQDSGPGPVSVETFDNPGGGSGFQFSFADGPSTILSAGSGSQPTTYDVLSIENRTTGVDNCGDPPGDYSPGDGYEGEDYGDPQTIEGPDGNDYTIVVSPPIIDDGGGVSIPVSIDGIELDIGPGNSDSPAGPTSPDYDNPSGTNSPGPGGGADGGDNPPDGIVVVRNTAAVTVLITQEPPNSTREVGGPENVFVPGTLFDAGWFRWRVEGATTKPQRITNRHQHFIFSPGVCENADGYEVKFSRGFSGSSRDFACQQ